MKSSWVSRSSENRRAIMLFAGWGCGASMFGGLSKPGYDIVVFWDYRDEDFDESELSGYDELYLIGWSMGVLEATRVLADSTLPIVGCLAVNGTLTPVDDRFGIPTEIFYGTLKGLNPQNLLKFYRRMCGSAAVFNRHKSELPERALPELVEELSLIGGRAVKRLPAHWKWSSALVGGNDAIFPPANQKAAWPSGTIVEVWNEMGHLPDWQKIFDCYIVDKDLVASRFKERRSSYVSEGRVQAHVADHLFKLWSPAVDRPLDIIESGAGNGFFTRCYAPVVTLKSLKLWDIADIDQDIAESVEAETRVCDAERAMSLQPDESADCIVSSSTVQWFNALPRFIDECHRVLRAGGELVISTYGPSTFGELRNLGLPLPSYPTEESLLSMFADGWEVTGHEQEFLNLEFASPADALTHIKLTGVNAIHRRPRPVGELRRLLTDYPANESERYPLTYQPIYIIAKKKTNL